MSVDKEKHLFLCQVKVYLMPGKKKKKKTDVAKDSVDPKYE